MPEGFRVNPEGQSERGLVVWCHSAAHPACWVRLQTRAQGGREVPSGAVPSCGRSHRVCFAPRRATAATWTWGSAAAARTPAGRECHCHRTAPGAPRTPPSPTPPVGAGAAQLGCRQWAGGQSSLQNAGVRLEGTESGWEGNAQHWDRHRAS